jgi:hypothetical protein
VKLAQIQGGTHLARLSHDFDHASWRLKLDRHNWVVSFVRDEAKRGYLVQSPLHDMIYAIGVVFSSLALSEAVPVIGAELRKREQFAKGQRQRNRRLSTWPQLRPKTIVTDKLGSYRAALRTIGNAACQQTGRWLNNRVENSHQPLRRRERAMQRFRQMRTLQKFAAIHSSVHNHFNQERHLYSRENFKLNRATALAEWRELSAA